MLGATGRNFAAGMSGGIAYVYDENGTFKDLCNQEMVSLELLDDPEEEILVKRMIHKHAKYTHSPLAKRMIENWGAVTAKFVKVIPYEYKRYLMQQEEVRSNG